MRIIFMGTPDFAVPSLQQCIDHFDVVAVYTQPDRPVGRGLELRPSPVKQLALQKAIPVFQPEKLTLPGEYEKLVALRPDVIVVVAYGQILKKNVLELPPLKCINLHSSVLPRWRGAAPIHHTLLAGDSVAGVSTMYMAEKLDAGNVLMTDSFPLQGFETVTELHDRLSNLGAQLLIKTLNWIEKEKPQGTIQDESLVTYATKLEKSMEWLDPQMSVREVSARIRALNPWPGTSIWLARGVRLRIRKVGKQIIQGTRAGQLFEKNGMLLLGTSDGSVEVEKIQWDGKKEMSAADFFNGLRGQQIELPLEWTSYSAKI